MSLKAANVTAQAPDAVPGKLGLGLVLPKSMGACRPLDLFAHYR